MTTLETKPIAFFFSPLSPAAGDAAAGRPARDRCALHRSPPAPLRLSGSDLLTVSPDGAVRKWRMSQMRSSSLVQSVQAARTGLDPMTTCNASHFGASFVHIVVVGEETRMAVASQPSARSRAPAFRSWPGGISGCTSRGWAPTAPTTRSRSSPAARAATSTTSTATATSTASPASSASTPATAAPSSARPPRARSRSSTSTRSGATPTRARSSSPRGSPRSPPATSTASSSPPAARRRSSRR